MGAKETKQRAAKLHAAASLEKLAQALPSIRDLWATIGKAHASAKTSPVAAHYERAYEWVKAAMTSLKNAEQALLRAQPGGWKRHRPERRREGARAYRKMRTDTLERCTLCTALCWPDQRGLHLIGHHREVLGGLGEIDDLPVIREAVEMHFEVPEPEGLDDLGAEAEASADAGEGEEGAA